jgi:hypothetical protein
VSTKVVNTSVGSTTPETPSKFVEVDVYEVLIAWAVTCPGRQQAIKKLLCAGQRGKGDELADLIGADAALSRAIDFQKRRHEDFKLHESIVRDLRATGRITKDEAITSLSEACIKIPVLGGLGHINAEPGSHWSFIGVDPAKPGDRTEVPTVSLMDAKHSNDGEIAIGGHLFTPDPLNTRAHETTKTCVRCGLDWYQLSRGTTRIPVCSKTFRPPESP